MSCKLQFFQPKKKAHTIIFSKESLKQKLTTIENLTNIQLKSLKNKNKKTEKLFLTQTNKIQIY